MSAVLLVALAGCDQNLNMVDQKKYHEWERGALFRNGQVVQTPVAGTVPRGAIERAAQLAQRPALSAALLDRGRERFDIYCSPCHGRLGDGHGMIVQRGMPAPPTYHQDRLRNVPDEHFVDVITHGFGVMYAYNDRVAPADRWAITAYIRALQRSQNTNIAEVPSAAKDKLTGAP